MKPSPSSQNSNHNFLHWLAVVLMRTARFLILAFIGAHLAAIGFSLSQETIASRLPSNWPEKITLYSHQLPYFSQANVSLFQRIDHWYTNAPVWWAMVVGLPLILIGLTTVLINFFNLYYAFFSPTYNQTHCPFCKQPAKIK